uniref:Uncharacterized protein n=1 Tax=Brassica campestris TaxID=3711 RepID=M4D0Y9_BRACM
MSSSQGGKRSSDVEMGETTTLAPIPTSSVEAPACVAGHLSFRKKLARRKAEKEPVRAGTEFPSSSALAVAPDRRTEVQERAAESMPPPPARKEIVLALRAPSAVPIAQPKGRKKKFTKGGDGESSQQGGSSLASRLRGKLMSLIDGMISECGSEDSHSAKVSKLEVEIGELERDLGKKASSLLKEKKAKKAKSSECIRSRDLALAKIEGGMAVVRAFQSETPWSLEAEETRLSDCKGDLAAVDGDFDLVLADLKSACFLPTWSEDPEGKDPVVGENGGDAVPSLDEVMGEERA